MNNNKPCCCKNNTETSCCTKKENSCCKSNLNNAEEIKTKFLRYIVNMPKKNLNVVANQKNMLCH